MRFILIDKLISIDPGRRARAVKHLSLAEEYLGDHFPAFPVLPGVLMIQAMVETCAWVVRTAEDFAHSVIVLRGARNVTYGNFVAPADVLQLDVETVKLEPASSSFKVQGTMGEVNVVKGRLELAHYNLAERQPRWAEEDARLIEHLRRQFRLLGGPAALAAGRTGS